MEKTKGSTDMYPWIHWQSFKSRDIQRQEIETSALEAVE
jgi:hypothetical protein